MTLPHRCNTTLNSVLSPVKAYPPFVAPTRHRRRYRSVLCARPSQNSGFMTLTNRAIISNSASGAGGAILNQGALTLDNTNISGNSAISANNAKDGGGIVNSSGWLGNIAPMHKFLCLR